MVGYMALRGPPRRGSREEELEAVELGKRLDFGGVERSAEPTAHRE